MNDIYKCPEIKEIIIDPDHKKYTLPFEIAEKLSITPKFLKKDELVKFVRDDPEGNLFKTAKKILFFTENKGKFLKKCPGSKGVICCNYYTINSVTGCPYDCSYCILQHYIENNPFITVFLNRGKAIEEIKEFLQTHEKIRVGTGELADSLALDHLLNETGFFIGEISKAGLSNKVQFEFKTKSAEIEQLLEISKQYPSVDIVAGFSVNIPGFQESEESGTASIQERLNAATTLQEAGIKIAIHFDPVIMLDLNFEKYMQLIDTIFTAIDCSKVAWISMGGFRHTLNLTETILKRFPESPLLMGEMFPSDTDNKLRYLATVRRHFYKAFVGRISHHFKGNPPLYMCMEKAFMWKDTGLSPASSIF